MLEKQPKNYEEYKKLIKEGYEKTYEIFLKKYGDLDTSQLESLEKFIKMLNGEKVLDVGCGGGKDSNFFEKMGLEVYSLDISEIMCSLTKKRIDIGEVINSDMNMLPFRENVFDGIWCNSSIVHLPDELKYETIFEFRRVLKENGILYICCHNILYPRMLKPIIYSLKSGHLWPIKYREVYWWPTSKWKLKKYLLDAKFKILYENSGFGKWIKIYARKK